MIMKWKDCKSHVDINTLGFNKMGDSLRTTFANAFPCKNIFGLKFHWKFVDRGLVNYKSALLQVMVSMAMAWTIGDY